MERQHAVIEYNESDGCFVVQDLNSAHGTYVNECRVQNAAVRLAPGDVIRFGYGILWIIYCNENGSRIKMLFQSNLIIWNLFNHETPPFYDQFYLSWSV